MVHTFCGLLRCHHAFIFCSLDMALTGADCCYGVSAGRNAIVFLTLYLQLLGMSDAAASALMALFLAGRCAQ